MTILTMTGIDWTVPTDWIKMMQRKFVYDAFGGRSAIEFAFLRSPKVGQSPRYPKQEVIKRICGYVYPDFLAFHLCGEYARMVHDGRWTELCDIVDFRLVSRVQVNSTEADEKAILNLMRFSAHIRKEVVMQWRDPVFPFAGGLNLLQDRSGGTGKLPDSWATPDKLCRQNSRVHNMGYTRIGYAGGLNPDNVKEELAKIKVAANGKPFWIDCESGIRTNDLFDIEKAEQMALNVFEFFGMKTHDEKKK